MSDPRSSGLDIAAIFALAVQRVSLGVVVIQGLPPWGRVMRDRGCVGVKVLSLVKA